MVHTEIYLLVIISFASASGSGYGAARLYKHLLVEVRDQPYIKEIPPQDEGAAVKVQLGLVPIQIIDVDEAAGAIEMNVWLALSWTDIALTWAPNNHDNVTHLSLPVSQIWTPEVSLWNDASHEDPGVPVNKLASVNNKGSVVWITQRKFKFACLFDLHYFPHDSHTCHIKIGQWTHPDSTVALSFSGNYMDITRYPLVTLPAYDYLFQAHPEWHFKHTDSSEMKYESSDPDYGSSTYTSLVYDFKLTRHDEYYGTIFYGPGFLIALLIPMMYVLVPINKFMLGSGLLVSITVLLEILENKIPVAHGTVPVIAEFYVSLFFCTCCVMLISVVTANLADRANYRKPPHALVKKIFIGILGRIVCVREHDYITIQSAPPPVSMQNLNTSEHADDAEFTTDYDTNQIVPNNNKPANITESSESAAWRAIASSLDRSFLIIHILLMIIFILEAMIQG